MAASVLSVRRWWLEERRLVLAWRLVKMSVVCQSVGNSLKTEDFSRSLKVLICCVDILRL